MKIIGRPTATPFNPGKLGGGKSAYEIAVSKGFEGTEEEWLESLKGDPGYTPQKGVDYTDGKPGDDGKTAYQYAQDGGYTGTEAQFAENLAKECPTKVSQLQNDRGYITGYTETDPTVPAWAKNATKPQYTPSEVGLGNVDNVKQYSANNPPPYPVTSVNGKTGAVSLDSDAVGAEPFGASFLAVNDHNTQTDAHNDMRLLITALTTRLDALANSDDTTLDQMAEVVAYIKANRDLIEQVTTGKVSITDIVDNLTTNVANKPLSAAQGVALKALIDGITVPTKLSQLADDSAHRTVTDTEKSAWNAKSTFSGKYDDLTGKPLIPVVPEDVSAFNNDAGYLTGETDPTVPAWAKATNKPSYSKSEVGLGNVDNVKQYSANNPPPYPVTSVNGKTGAVSLATETWTFTLENGSTVNKVVYIG